MLSDTWYLNFKPFKQNYNNVEKFYNDLSLSFRSFLLIRPFLRMKMEKHEKCMSMCEHVLAIKHVQTLSQGFAQPESRTTRNNAIWKVP
jgi:hypothetical protein